MTTSFQQNPKACPIDVYFPWGTSLEWHFPIDYDTRAAVTTLRKIKRISESEELQVWISHDPEDWAKYQHAPHFFD